MKDERNDQCWSLLVTSVRTTAPLSRTARPRHNCSPGQTRNLNPVRVGGGGGGAANRVPWDSEWSLHNATFHFPLHSAKGSPPPVGQWTGEPRPDEGRSLGKWLAARSKIGSPPPQLTASLPTVQDEDVVRWVKQRPSRVAHVGWSQHLMTSRWI